MTTSNPLKEIMVAAGYTNFNSDNRSYHTRSINNILKDGRVVVEVCAPGKVWIRKTSGKQYNIRVIAAGWTTRTYSSNVNGFSILRVIGDHLQIPEVREKILSEVSLHKHCEKCNGHGIIPAFHYYCNGICFDCCGTGFSKMKDLVEIKNTDPVS